MKLKKDNPEFAKVLKISKSVVEKSRRGKPRAEEPAEIRRMLPPSFSNQPPFEYPEKLEPALAAILRRAAGQAEVPDPTEYYDDDPVYVMNYVHCILAELPNPAKRTRPNKVAAELEKLQLDIGDLRRRIEKIDAEAKTELNHHAASEECNYWVWDDDPDRRGKAYDDVHDRATDPPETWAVQSTVAAMRLLERAMARTIEFARLRASRTPATGRRRDEKAYVTAGIVAQYIVMVTGKPPGPRLRYSGSDFERTLAEIFELLDIKADPQAPAKAVLLELSKIL